MASLSFLYYHGWMLQRCEYFTDSPKINRHLLAHVAYNHYLCKHSINILKNIIMRKLLRLFLLVLTATISQAAFAEEETVDFSKMGLENGTQYKELTGTNITCTFGKGANDGKYYDAGTGIRVYGDGYMTVSTAKGNITKIVVTYSGSQYKPTANNIVDGGAYDAATSTWTGSAASVKFTRPTGKGHWRIQKVVVTYTADASAVAAPTISGTTPFENSTEVSLKADAGAKIYYTTDGKTPTTSSTLYTAPFTLSEDATVAAIAVKDGKTSSVATKTFTKVVFTTMSFDEACALPTTAAKQYIKLELENAKVVYVDGSTVFLRQDGQSMMLYNVDQKALTLNATVSGTIKLDFKPYNDLPEMVANTFTNSENLTITTSSSTELDAVEATVADLLAKKHLCALVVLKGATITSEGSGTSTNYYITSGESKIQLWGNQTLSKAGVGKTLDIYAVCNSIHNGAVQLKPVKVGDITLGIDDTLVTTQTVAKGVYTIDGVKMGEDKALPNGLYIVNGKKVIVNNK